ncbi:MAG: C25 family cysteine peptidase [Bacteroidales bacterium]|jgi:gingipain R|nr:C25 family cysteine peptidase [Bacteroidales bacterium]
MKNFIFSVLLLFSINTLSCQEIHYSIISSDNQSITIQVDFPASDKTEISIDGETYYRLAMPGAYHILEQGAPEVLITAQSIIIPDNVSPTVEIISEEFSEKTGFKLAPSRGKIYRNVDPSTISFTKGDEYATNAFYPAQPCKVNEPYKLRDFHGTALSFFPVTYNPVGNTLKEYKNIVVKINYNVTKSNIINKKTNKEFSKVYQKQFLNYEETKYDAMGEEGSLLIIAPEEFVPSMRPLANWKIKSGIPTEIVAYDTIATSQSTLKTYLTNYYANNNLTYVLLVGDYMQIPSYRSRGKSFDNVYAQVDGNDNYPDFFLGRFSAETVEHVETQVQKTIMYESAPVETLHLPVYAGIASQEGPGENGEYDYEHIRYIGNKLADYTYTSGYEFFEGSKGGLDESGDPRASAISHAINNGVGIINYCGHGDWDIFETGYFMNSHVQALTNYNKLPFIIATACSNGEYVLRTCFAEYWLRAKKDEQLTGAVATLMSTIVQAWNPPMAGQDEINNLLTKSAKGCTVRTFGGLTFSGLCEILDTYYDYETSNTWIIFGDPSLRYRTAVPSQIAITHPAEVNAGNNSITLSTSFDDVEVTLSCRAKIVASGIINNDSFVVNIDDMQDYDTLHVVGNKYNHIPYIGFIKVKNGGANIPTWSSSLETGLLYPNPATDFVTIDQQDFPSDDNVECLIFNIEGRKMKRIQASKSNNKIDIQELATGSYVLKMMSKGKEARRYKFMVS